MANIKGLRFPDLRHTTGTRIGDVGTAATIIADIVGHSDLKNDEAVRPRLRSGQEASDGCSGGFPARTVKPKIWQIFREESRVERDGTC
jgi:hypothetical protein